MINFVIAHLAEAAPVIEHWKLKKSNAPHPFPLYENDGAKLIVCGNGKCNSAAATSWLASTADNLPSKNTIWINLGIAGHANHSIGALVTASKLIDSATGHCWHPVLIKNQIPQSTVCTVDKPSLDYSDRFTYEMEASGFYSTALRFSTAELAQCIKVISDNRHQPVEKFNRNSASELVSSQLGPIEHQCEILQELAQSIQDIDTREVESQLHGAYRFTVTQQHILRRLLVRHQASFGHLNLEMENVENHATLSTSQFLQHLNTRINAAHQ